MHEQFIRTALLFGESGMARLANARVAVFGIGGVGGHAAEALARSGVGTLDLIDGDVVNESNINRQIIALHSTLGQPKVEVMAARVLDINPACIINTHPLFFDEKTADAFDFAQYDYVLDAIDSVSSKLLLIETCHAAGTKIISCMGAGNKLDPTQFEVADIYQTSVCPLAKVVRQELRRRGIPALQVVYSREPPAPNSLPPESMPPLGKLIGSMPPNGKLIGSMPPLGKLIGSTSFVPSAAGLIMAGEAVKALVNAEY